MRDDGGLVYSTGIGRIRTKGTDGRQRIERPPPGDGVVRVRRETAGRRGKTVTTVTGVPLAGDDLGALAGRLKKACGSGGTVRDGAVIELQGDHRPTVVRVLEGEGWTVKLAGG